MTCRSIALMWVVFLSIATQALEAAEATETRAASVRQYRAEIREQLKRHAKAGTLAEQLRESLALVALAERLPKVEFYRTSEILQGLHRDILVRLRTVKKDAERQLRRFKRRPATITLDSKILAQLNQAAFPNQGPNAANGAANAANGVTATDYAPQLIEVIQRTISPEYWDVNGGSSAIRYWRPGMALVVRAPGTVHDEVAPLLRQLRRQ